MKRDESPQVTELANRLDVLKEVPERDPAAAAKGLARFLKQAARQQSWSSEHVHRNIHSIFLIKKPQWAFHWSTAVFLALALLFGAGAVTVHASQATLPGQALYPVKIMSEDSLLFLTPTAEKRLDLTLAYTDRRAEEISRLRSAGQPIPQTLVDRYVNELNQSLRLSAAFEGQNMLDSLLSVSRHAEKQLEIMDSVQTEDKNPTTLSQTQLRLENQIDQARIGQADPQAFRQKMQSQSHSDKGKSNGNPPGQTTLAPAGPQDEATPTPAPKNNPKQTKKPDDKVPGSGGHPHDRNQAPQGGSGK